MDRLWMTEGAERLKQTSQCPRLSLCLPGIRSRSSYLYVLITALQESRVGQFMNSLPFQKMTRGRICQKSLDSFCISYYSASISKEERSVSDAADGSRID